MYTRERINNVLCLVYGMKFPGRPPCIPRRPFVFKDFEGVMYFFKSILNYVAKAVDYNL